MLYFDVCNYYHSQFVCLLIRTPFNHGKGGQRCFQMLYKEYKEDFFTVWMIVYTFSHASFKQTAEWKPRAFYTRTGSQFY